jgi:hypothetical protein
MLPRGDECLSSVRNRNTTPWFPNPLLEDHRPRYFESFQIICTEMFSYSVKTCDSFPVQPLCVI